MRAVIVVETGPLATLQDLGRPGYAHLGVPRSGGADRGSLTLANRLVGNPESAAVIETTLGGLRIRARDTLFVVVTGADARVTVDGTPTGLGAAVALPDGTELAIGTPTRGLRNYVAVRGGFDVAPVLGSRSTDTLSGLGPAPLARTHELSVGRSESPWPATTSAPVATFDESVVTLEITDGPRGDRVRAVRDLLLGVWEVSPHSNRVGVRIDRPGDSDDPLITHLEALDELASEGIPAGAVQVPPSGRPVLFGADHPVTGGYPVVAVLTPASIDRAAQLVPGTHVRFRTL